MAPDSPIVLTLLGMGTVMIVLTMIMYMIIIMGKVLAPKTVPVAPTAPAAPSYNKEEEETLAVIMAAVSNMIGTKNIGSINVKPKN
ncbi:MAG: OadG family transporter subunit [Candidatus Fimivivens sp.]|nr:OadG family transporter subunit [Candidatus Fimivivens sp.]